MPYISEDRRQHFEATADLPEPRNAGELNYVFSVIARDYIDIKGESYQNMNDVLGALEGAKLEFYRRVVVPYEIEKIEQNGDLY